MILYDVLDYEQKESIKNTVSSLDFPWFWRDGLIIFDRNVEDDLAKKYYLPESPMFMHQISKRNSIYNDVLFKNIVTPILLKFQEKSGLKIKYVNRSQVNLVPRVTISQQEFEGSLHRDRQSEEDVNHDKLITILYYPITSDGPTVTYDEEMNVTESCDPVENSIFYFNSVILHRLFVPKINKRRLSININVEIY
jgi:hypothetical protein